MIVVGCCHWSHARLSPAGLSRSPRNSRQTRSALCHVLRAQLLDYATFFSAQPAQFPPLLAGAQMAVIGRQLQGSAAAARPSRGLTQTSKQRKAQSRHARSSRRRQFLASNREAGAQSLPLEPGAKRSTLTRSNQRTPGMSPSRGKLRSGQGGAVDAMKLREALAAAERHERALVDLNRRQADGGSWRGARQPYSRVAPHPRGTLYGVQQDGRVQASRGHLGALPPGLQPARPAWMQQLVGASHGGGVYAASRHAPVGTARLTPFSSSSSSSAAASAQRA